MLGFPPYGRKPRGNNLFRDRRYYCRDSAFTECGSHILIAGDFVPGEDPIERPMQLENWNAASHLNQPFWLESRKRLSYPFEYLRSRQAAVVASRRGWPYHSA